MAGVNKVILVGNLTRDPDCRRMNDGTPVVNLNVATNETWRDKQSGERREKAEFHRIVIFNEHIAKVAEQYLRKGAKVYVEGQLQTRKWQDNSGNDRYATEIVLQRYRGELQMLDSREGGRDTSEEYRRQARGDDPAMQRPSGGGESGEGLDLEDSIPFVSPWGAW